MKFYKTVERERKERERAVLSCGLILDKGWQDAKE
jgi:hypothetical protein